MDAQTAIQLLRAQLPAIQNYGVARIALFGPVARNESSPESDVDVLVEFEPLRISFNNYMGLKEFLGELFGRAVDLLTVQSRKPYVRDEIMSQAIYAA